jgi:uncharacterized ion transporter superfamily protein YfcC
LRLPHPLLLLFGCVAMAAALTWVLPAGEFDRRVDERTGRTVVVPDTYHRVPAAPVGPLAAVVAVPHGFVEAADVVAVVLFVGGAWVILDTMGILGRLVGALVWRLRGRALFAIPLVTAFFATMGAIENMQEEIIPLVPVLLVLGRSLRVDALTVVAMSAGAAMIGSAFGPTNPFQAGIAMRLAQLPPLAGGAVKLALCIAAVGVWLAWTLRHATRTRTTRRDRENPSTSEPQNPNPGTSEPQNPGTSPRDLIALLCLLSPMALYVYGAMAWEWGFNELSAGFLAGGLAAGLVAGLGLGRTIELYLDGMRGLLSAAVIIGVARGISLVLADGHVVDTILHALAEPLVRGSATVSALLMVPFHALIHVPVSSVSGQAVLTMPLLVPLSDLIGISRQTTVLAYQIGAGLTELLTPTNGALMAVLLAAGVPFDKWIRFAGGAVLFIALMAMLVMVTMA